MTATGKLAAMSSPSKSQAAAGNPSDPLTLSILPGHPVSQQRQALLETGWPNHGDRTG